jgi:four helix bundle protein
MTLRVHKVADELVDAAAPLVREVHRHDNDLAKQLRRALQSIPLNIAEVAPGKAWEEASMN